MAGSCLCAEDMEDEVRSPVVVAEVVDIEIAAEVEMRGFEVVALVMAPDHVAAID